jgi:hypothetical protein
VTLFAERPRKLRPLQNRIKRRSQIFEYLEHGPRVATADQLNRHSAASRGPNQIGPVVEPSTARPFYPTPTTITTQYLGVEAVVWLRDRHEALLW